MKTELENIDDECADLGIDFVMIDDAATAKKYGIKSLPGLVFFRNEKPLKYEGDLADETSVLEWLINEKGETVDVIESVDRNTLEELLEEVDYIAVFFYDAEDCETCDQILEELENIDDDTDKYGIHFVKTDDDEYAREIGLTELPALVYFEDGSPSIYDEDLLNEEEVLKWLLLQRTEDTIENINRDIFFRFVAEKEYLAVLFYKVRFQKILSFFIDF